MNSTIVYTIPRSAVAWTAYLDVLAQYRVYKTRLDISEYLDFTFYDCVWSYKDNARISNNMFGRWLAVSHQIGNLMSYWILTANGCVISRTTVQRVVNVELVEVQQIYGAD
jgi:hypothetical protein